MLIEHVSINKLKPAKYNPRKIDQGQLDSLAEAIKRYGFVQPVVANTNGNVVIGGHQRLKAAKMAGMDTVPVHFVTLDANEEMALNIALNKIGGDFDQAKLETVLKDLSLGGFSLDDFGAIGFNQTELQAINLAPTLTANDLKPAGGNLDSEPPKVITPITKTGDVYTIGNHRLVCGDSTDPHTVAKLMDGHQADMVFTDPPYAIFGSSNGLAADICDDKMVRPFFRSILAAIQASLKLYGHSYVFCDWRSWGAWWEECKSTQLAAKNMIVWDKGNGLGAMYTMGHELMLFCTHEPSHSKMRNSNSGQRTISDYNVWKIGRTNHKEKIHNAQKPVELVERAIKNSSDNGDRVLDLFGGSGSTMVAAQKIGRSAYLMEYEPNYCDGIVKRMQFCFPGIKITRNGEPLE